MAQTTCFILIIKQSYQEQKQNLWATRDITLGPTSIFNHKRLNMENDFTNN